VSDDTIYRALKDLGFSHVSARPKAYKQDADRDTDGETHSGALAPQRKYLHSSPRISC
jgi:Winged helix-turn helix